MLLNGRNKKKNCIFLYYLWSLIFLSYFKRAKCGLKVFPESICQNDEIYTYSNKAETIDQIYKAGYYTDNAHAGTGIYYSKKSGITYDKDTTCTNINTAYSSSPFTSTNFDVYDSNYDNPSNEYNLFKYFVGNASSFICNAPFPKIMNKNYKLSYRVSVLITGSNSNINISFHGDNFIDFTMNAVINKIYFFNFIIISKDHSDPTKRIMSFTYEGITKSITVSNNIKIKH